MSKLLNSAAVSSQKAENAGEIFMHFLKTNPALVLNRTAQAAPGKNATPGGAVDPLPR